MKKERLLILSGSILMVSLLAALPFMAACAKPAPAPTPAKPIELSLNLQIPPTHQRWVDIEKPWIEELERRCGGRIKITPHYAASLTSAAENYQSAVDGRADMATAFCWTAPGRFPSMDIGGLPTLTVVSDRQSHIYWELYKKFPEIQKEFADTHVLFIYGGSWMSFATRGKPVLTLEDLKGMRIHTNPGYPTKVAKALGVSPVAMKFGDVYIALEKGVLDGSILNYDLLLSRKFGEVVDHFAIAAVQFSTPFYFVMNKQKWESLPKDIQKIFDEMGGDYAVDLEDKGQWANNEESRVKAEKEMGVKFHKISKEEIARWNKAVQPVKDEFAGELEAKGLPGKKIVEEFYRLIDKYAVKGYLD